LFDKILYRRLVSDLNENKMEPTDYPRFLNPVFEDDYKESDYEQDYDKEREYELDNE
jgi:hypothetical protein